MNVNNALERVAGISGCYICLDSGDPYDMPVGYAAYAAVVRVDETIITSIFEYVDGGPVEVTDLSWETISLLKGDLITFENPVVQITLDSSDNSLICYLMPTDFVA